MAYKRRGGNKYHAKKAIVDGVTFDSVKEAKRYKVLKEKAEMGQISSLQRQFKFVLIPTQREPDTVGPKGGIKKGKLLEKECAYIADFVYQEKQEDGSWRQVVEDTKGFRTSDYIIKRKLMLYIYGIRIKEI